MPTENIPILISVSVFLSIFLLFVGVLYYARQRVRTLRLLGRIGEGQEDGQMPQASTAPLKADGMMKVGILNLLGSLGKQVSYRKSLDYSRMRVKFLKAGFRRQDVFYVFWATKCLLAAALPVFFLLFRLTVFEIISYPLTVAIVVFLIFLGFYLPGVWLRIRIGRRKEKIKDGFADVVDLLVVCVEAGMGLDAAMNRVGQEIEISNKAWNEELKLYNLELRAGKSRRDALKNLAIRTDVEDIKSLATSLIQTDKFGTSLAKSLRVYSDSFRTKRYQTAEEIAAKLPVKLVFPTILFILPSLFVTLVGPAVFRIYDLLIRH